MFGSRKRIGYISPSVLEVVPYDFYRFAPDGVGLVGVTCNIDDWTQDHFDRALGQVKEAAAYLGARKVDYIVHGGGPLVVARGKGYEDLIVNDIEAVAKVPATTGVRSGMEALRHVGARRIAIASPYPERHNAALSAYLTAQGFEIVRAEGKDLPFKDMQNLPPADIHAFAGRRPRSRRRVRRALSPLPAMAGRAGGGRDRARTFVAGRLLHARKFLRRVPHPRHQGRHPRPRPPARLAVGDQMMRATIAVTASLIVGALASADAHAQSVADFYRGKTIEILVGAAAGGGYDVVARLIANHMTRHIPGNPTIVVRNMPGATGLIMTNHLYNVARRDGTVIGMPTSNVPIEPRLRLISPDGSDDQVRHRPLWLDRHAAAGAAGDLGVAHGAGKERRRPQEHHHPDGRDHGVRGQFRSCRCWSIRSPERA